MQYVDRSLVRPEWVTGLPRGEAFVRTRGENWKLRVPLLEPVPKDELENVAGHYGLATVFAELKGEAEAREDSTKEETDLATGRTAPAASGGTSEGKTEGGSRETASATSLEDSSGELGAALNVEESEGEDAMVR